MHLMKQPVGDQTYGACMCDRRRRGGAWLCCVEPSPDGRGRRCRWTYGRRAPARGGSSASWRLKARGECMAVAASGGGDMRQLALWRAMTCGRRRGG